MGYFSKLSGKAPDQPIQAAQEPPVQAAPGAPNPVSAAPPAVQEPLKANDVTAEKFQAETEPIQKAQQAGEVPSEPIQLEVPSDDSAARQAHDTAEAKRKAEWDKKQAEKRAAEQAELDKLAALSDEDVSRIAAHRVGADTEKITRRNMKEQVSEHIQSLCQRDPMFARRTMLPGKSMVECFRHITRQAYQYVQDEMKANDIKPGPGAEGYGADVPDDLCFQWAQDYFDAPVEETEEKFVPRPYVPKAGGKPTPKKAQKPKKEAKPTPKPKENSGVVGQISLLGA